jgi:hypothetical protein
MAGEGGVVTVSGGRFCLLPRRTSVCVWTPNVWMSFSAKSVMSAVCCAVLWYDLCVWRALPGLTVPTGAARREVPDASQKCLMGGPTEFVWRWGPRGPHIRGLMLRLCIQGGWCFLKLSFGGEGPPHRRAGGAFLNCLWGGGAPHHWAGGAFLSFLKTLRILWSLPTLPPLPSLPSLLPLLSLFFCRFFFCFFFFAG